jgi:hypothetical protein
MSSGCNGNQCGNIAYIRASLAGDTVIEGLRYKIVTSNYVELSNTCNCSTKPPFPLSGFLREDTVARKVYWRGKNTYSDKLLYDFTLKVGDTLKGYLVCSGIGQLNVSFIDSVIIGGNYRRRVNFNWVFAPDGKFSIIEGIGANTGLMLPFCNIMDKGYRLECFSANNQVIYTARMEDTIPCGELPLSISEPKTTLRFVTISPNPANFQVNLTFSPNSMPASIKILDLWGRMYLEREIDFEKTTIDTSKLPAGIYILLAEKNGAIVYHDKILKL